MTSCQGMMGSELATSEMGRQKCPFGKGRLCGGATINSTSHLPWLQKLQNDMAIPASEATIRREDVDQSYLFEAVASRRGLGGDKRVCLTPDGYLGTDANAAIASNQVCYSLGNNISCILQPDKGRTTHRIVGEAYVHDFMHAGALELGLYTQDTAIC
jgi:hypothetical protein